MLEDLFQALDWPYFFLSALLFMIGIYAGPHAAEKEITLLLKYPRWMLRLMLRYFKPGYPIPVIFLLIFLLNNLSLFSSFVSGFLVIFPPLAAFLTGFNVAVIMFEMMGWRGIWQILVNPVAWLEFPASWISFSLGFRLAETQLARFHLPETLVLFRELWPVYLKYVGGLLLLAAALETLLIVITRRFPENGE
ncbi:MAG: hypothetical protein HUU32_22130 [Calditrichaceae bacterium]|nr:hypothetical protein [Calditrichia bacterium]NUQ44092.1 hypothetical protein [Calditrichaceae bacterium]